MAEELSSLILQLSTYHPVGAAPKPKALRFIKNYRRFISTLNNINSMIGLETVKGQVASQVKFFIVNYRRYGQPTNGERLHALLYGSPGCGKTKLGKFLAELWAVAGCIPNPKKKSEGSPPPRILVNPVGIDSEKIKLKNEVILRQAQLKQSQMRLAEVQKSAGETLTLLNNTRKRVKSRVPEKEAHTQAKFQEIKRRLKEMSGLVLIPVGPSAGAQVLPVTVPRTAGDRSRFGNEEIANINRLNLPDINGLPALPDIPNSNYPSELLPDVDELDEQSFDFMGSDEEDEDVDVKFVALTRGDLVGKFQGHTAARVRDVLNEYEGGVVFIDEAYGLITGSNDDFGKECLTEIINYMSSYPDKVIFIFAGYRKEMEDTVLKFQPGLSRRFNWTFEIEKYESEDLAKIFKQQLSSDMFDLTDDTFAKVNEFFVEHKDEFPHFGGDTENLANFVKEICYGQHWISALDDKLSEEHYLDLFTNVEFESIEDGFQKYLNNSIHHRGQEQRQISETIRATMYN